MTWHPVEIMEDYWIIEDQYGAEYEDEVGDCRMFYSKQEAKDYIKKIEEAV